jgi:hypothetical protein
MATKTDKETVVGTKAEENKQIIFNDEVNFSAGPCTDIKGNWNQITLSLASNGGFTISQGRKSILNVYISENVNGKKVHSVKSFLVTKEELTDLINESREFVSEIEKMIEARDLEESKLSLPKEPIKDNTKDFKKKKPNTKALNDMLKKSIDSIRKKEIDRVPEEVEESEEYDNFNRDTIVTGDLEIDKK